MVVVLLHPQRFKGTSKTRFRWRWDIFCITTDRFGEQQERKKAFRHKNPSSGLVFYPTLFNYFFFLLDRIIPSDLSPSCWFQEIQLFEKKRIGEEEICFMQQNTSGERPRAWFCHILSHLSYNKFNLISNVPRERKKEKLYYLQLAFFWHPVLFFVAGWFILSATLCELNFCFVSHG